MQELAAHRHPQNLHFSAFEFLIPEITFKSKDAILTVPSICAGCIFMFAEFSSSR